MGDIIVDQGVKNQFPHLKDTGFQSFCMQMVCLWQVQVLQTVLTYLNKNETTIENPNLSQPAVLIEKRQTATFS